MFETLRPANLLTFFAIVGHDESWASDYAPDCIAALVMADLIDAEPDPSGGHVVSVSDYGASVLREIAKAWAPILQGREDFAALQRALGDHGATAQKVAAL